MKQTIVDRTETRIRRMFASIAHRYDLLNRVLSGGIDVLWRRKSARILGAPDRLMLDVCTGTGDLALEFFRTHGEGFKIVGADFCRPMLRLGRSKLRRAVSPDRFLLVEADAQELPFPDNTFDIVTVAFGLRNVTDHRRGLAELVRVARPGGKVGVLDFALPRVPLIRSLYLFYFRKILPTVGQTIARNRDRAYEYLPASVLEFFEPEEMLELFRHHGLTDCRAIPFTFGISYLYVGQKPRQPTGSAECQPELAATVTGVAE